MAAQEADNYTNGSLPKNEYQLPPMGDDKAEVEGTTAERSPQVEGAALAFTGGDVFVLTLVAAGAIIAGFAVLGVRRRTQPTT